jgi:drug/metabolite transporter (DMT)-like permease
VVINQVLFVEGLYRTHTAHSAIINTGIPVATLLFALLAGTEQANGRKLTGIGLALGGVLYLLLHTGATMPGQFVTGDILTLLNGLSYSLFLVMSKPILSRYSSLGVTAWLLTFGAIMITALGLPQLITRDLSAVPAPIWWTGAFVVIFPTVLAYLLNSWALARVESSLVALFIYLQPLIAATLGIFWLGEPLGAETIIAAVFIFAGVGVAVWNPSRGNLRGAD